MKLSRNLFIIVLIGSNIALDQVTKVIVRATMTKSKPIDVIGDYFQLIWVENKGAFLGMGSDLNDSMKLIFLLVLPVLVLGYVIYYIFKTKHLDRWSLIAFCCIIGGALTPREKILAAAKAWRKRLADEQAALPQDEENTTESEAEEKDRHSVLGDRSDEAEHADIDAATKPDGQNRKLG
ncbi:MAG: signal peptidase II, partial [Bacteroidota bacterium]